MGGSWAGKSHETRLVLGLFLISHVIKSSLFPVAITAILSNLSGTEWGQKQWDRASSLSAGLRGNLALSAINDWEVLVLAGVSGANKSANPWCGMPNICVGIPARLAGLQKYIHNTLFVWCLLQNCRVSIYIYIYIYGCRELVRVFCLQRLCLCGVDLARDAAYSQFPMIIRSMCLKTFSKCLLPDCTVTTVHMGVA